MDRQREIAAVWGRLGDQREQKSSQNGLVGGLERSLGGLGRSQGRLGAVLGRSWVALRGVLGKLVAQGGF